MCMKYFGVMIKHKTILIKAEDKENAYRKLSDNGIMNIEDEIQCYEIPDAMAKCLTFDLYI